MSKELASLQVQLELQTAAFERGVARMDKSLKKVEKNTSRTDKSMKKLGKTLSNAAKGGAALAAAFAAVKLGQYASQALEYADSIAKVSAKVGVTTDELQQLRFAAEQSGVDIRTLDMALQRFSRRTGEVAAGTGELLKTWQALGIEINDQEGNMRPLTDLLGDYADAIQNAGSQQEKLRLAFKAFDSEGAALVNLLEGGAEAVEDFKQQAIDLGLVLDKDTTKVAEVLTDKLNILSKQALTGVSDAFIKATASALEFFGVFTDYDAAAERLEQVNKEIENQQQLLTTWAARVGQINPELKLVDLMQEKESLEKQLETLDGYRDKVEEVGEATDAAIATPEQLKRFTALRKEIEKLADPADAYAQKLADIKEAMLTYIRTSGELGISIEDAATLQAKITAEWLASTDAAVIYFTRVQELIDDSNSRGMNALADELGLLQAAYQQAMDAGEFTLADNLFELIADLELAGEKAADFGDSFKSMADEIKDSIDGFVTDFTNKLVDGLVEGELAFDDFAKSVLATIAKLVLNKIFTQFFDTILGGMSFFGGTGATASPTAISPDATMTRESGGTASMVTGIATAGSMPSAKSPVTVNVNNYGNDQVEVQERKTSRGIEIDVLIKQAVNKGLAGGDFDRAMRASYGAQRLAY